MPEPTLQFTANDAPSQELAILTKGEAGVSAEDRAQDIESSDADAAEEPAPDPVDLFVAAARLHMFPAPSFEPWDSDAELVSRSADAATGEVTYRVRLRNVHPGALRVLANLIVARLPEQVRIWTVKTPPGHVASLIDFHSLEYPSIVGQVPFPVDREEPARNSRDRSVQIELARPPDPKVVDVVCSGLDTWSQLPLFGGYPAETMKPWQSSAGPEPAFLLDSCTVEQAFPDLFLCDDDCYACVVNWARYLHRSVCPVASIVFR